MTCCSRPGLKKGDIPLVSMDGGQESFARIRDPASLLVATVAVPFESDGRRQAVDCAGSYRQRRREKGDPGSGTRTC